MLDSSTRRYKAVRTIDIIEPKSASSAGGSLLVRSGLRTSLACVYWGLSFFIGGGIGLYVFAASKKGGRSIVGSVRLNDEVTVALPC